MLASGRLTRGVVRSLLGEALDSWGPSEFVSHLAGMSDAALWDTRVWLATRGPWPSAADRFAADLGWAEDVGDPALRALTEAILQAPIPILTGGAGAGGDQFAPSMLAAAVTRQDVVDRQPGGLPAAILAAEVVSAEDLPFREADAGPGPAHHVAQSDNRWTRDRQANGPHVPPAIPQHLRLPRNEQPKRAARGAHVEGFEVGVQKQHRNVHRAGPKLGRIITPRSVFTSKQIGNS